MLWKGPRKPFFLFLRTKIITFNQLKDRCPVNRRNGALYCLWNEEETKYNFYIIVFNKLKKTQEFQGDKLYMAIACSKQSIF